MIAARKARRNQMLIVEKRKLLRLVQAQIELWDGNIMSVGATHVRAEVSTIAGLCSVSMSVFSIGCILGQFREPERAVKGGITMANPYNGKWGIYFHERITADAAAQRFIDAFSGFVGESAAWTLPPPKECMP